MAGGGGAQLLPLYQPCQTLKGLPSKSRIRNFRIRGQIGLAEGEEGSTSSSKDNGARILLNKAPLFLSFDFLVTFLLDVWTLFLFRLLTFSTNLSQCKQLDIGWISHHNILQKCEARCKLKHDIFGRGTKCGREGRKHLKPMNNRRCTHMYTLLLINHLVALQFSNTLGTMMYCCSLFLFNFPTLLALLQHTFKPFMSLCHPCVQLMIEYQIQYRGVYKRGC